MTELGLLNYQRFTMRLAGCGLRPANTRFRPERKMNNQRGQTSLGQAYAVEPHHLSL
jgi:hypothetical protein